MENLNISLSFIWVEAHNVDSRHGDKGVNYLLLRQSFFEFYSEGYKFSEKIHNLRISNRI